MIVNTTTTTFHNRPCLEFQNGQGKPFSLGAYKLRMILTALPEVRDWLIDQGETVPAEAINPVLFTGPIGAEKSTSSDENGALGLTLSGHGQRLIDAETRIETLEASLAIILEEITNAATPMDSDAGHRQMQLD